MLSVAARCVPPQDPAAAAVPRGPQDRPPLLQAEVPRQQAGLQGHRERGQAAAVQGGRGRRQQQPRPQDGEDHRVLAQAPQHRGQARHAGQVPVCSRCEMKYI